MSGAPWRRFPIGLTSSAMGAIALLIALGLWQVRRLEWKERVLAQIDALRRAPARPLESVLAAGRDAAFIRVEVRCDPAPAAPAPSLFRYAVRDGRIGWRLLSPCRALAGPYDGILLDRGIVEAFMGANSPRAEPFPAPSEVVGVLRQTGSKPWLGPAVMERGADFVALRVVDAATLRETAAAQGLARPAPYLLAVEHEAPAAVGLTPAALPTDIPNNHLVYALTWFALALICAWFYGALLMRRLRP
jgi:surfeit locus 1 family protein